MEPIKREAAVKTYFESPEIYLVYDYNLRVRRETLSEFIRKQKFENVLDMPCGAGDISIPFSDQFNHLTLVDFSENMMQLAQNKIPERQLNKITCIRGNIFDMSFPDVSFDLVLSLGILSHINDPMRLLKMLATVIQPGGTLIIQNTDSGHWYFKLINGYLKVKRILRKSNYKLNKISAKWLEINLTELGFKKQDQFRYNQSWIGFARIYSNQKKYELIRKIFGTVREKKHQSRGCEYIYIFRKDSGSVK